MTDNFHFVAQDGNTHSNTSDSFSAVRGRIMRFMRQMHSSSDEEALVQAAIDRSWLDINGAPTAAGQRLVRAFNDLDRFS